MKIHGYELTTEWKNSNCGQTARAEYADKEYFLKKYQTPVYPVMNGALDEKTFENNKAYFERYVALRKKVNTTIRCIAGEGGNIIVPGEEFVDDNHYIEASRFIENAIDDDELEGILNSLSIDVKKLLMLTAAGALASVHSKGIVHSDLKLKNVLLVKNSSGNYVAKLIDFDNSYFIDDIPEPADIGGSIDYCSPELAYYSSLEEEWEEEKKSIGVKSDIFSLGLIFHFYLAGELPKAKSLNNRLQKRVEKGKTIYCWEILANDCSLKLSNKITSLKYLMLIQDMLNVDPDKRPSAMQVLQRLKEADTDAVVEEPWEEHKILLDRDKLKAGKYVVFKKKLDSGKKEYELITQDGSLKHFTVDQLVEKGLAKRIIIEEFAEPWDIHSIIFNLDKIKDRQFVSSEQKIWKDIKGYEFYRADSSSHFFKVEDLLSMGYALKDKKPVEIIEGFCSPWEGHAIEFDIDQIKNKGYVRMEQAAINGVKGYNIYKSNGEKQFLKAEMLLVLKMAKKI